MPDVHLSVFNRDDDRPVSAASQYCCPFSFICLCSSSVRNPHACPHSTDFIWSDHYECAMLLGEREREREREMLSLTDNDGFVNIDLA